MHECVADMGIQAVNRVERTGWRFGKTDAVRRVYRGEVMLDTQSDQHRTLVLVETVGEGDYAGAVLAEELQTLGSAGQYRDHAFLGAEALHQTSPAGDLRAVESPARLVEDVVPVVGRDELTLAHALHPDLVHCGVHLPFGFRLFKLSQRRNVAAYMPADPGKHTPGERILDDDAIQVETDGQNGTHAASIAHRPCQCPDARAS